MEFGVDRRAPTVERAPGRGRGSLLGSHATIVHDEAITSQSEAAIAEIMGGERDVGKIDLELQPKSGEEFSAESRVAPFSFGLPAADDE